MELVICTIVCVCFLCLLICLFPVRSQHVRRPYASSSKLSKTKRIAVSDSQEDSQLQRESVPNKKHVSFAESNDTGDALEPHGERKMIPNKRHKSYVEDTVNDTTTRSTGDGGSGHSLLKRPLHNSYVMMKNVDAAPSGDLSYSKESLEEKLSNERMTRFATNMNYTSSLNKFIEYQERDFLDTVKVGDPNVRPIGGSFGCKVPSGSY